MAPIKPSHLQSYRDDEPIDRKTSTGIKKTSSKSSFRLLAAHMLAQFSKSAHTAAEFLLASASSGSSQQSERFSESSTGPEYLTAQTVSPKPIRKDPFLGASASFIGFREPSIRSGNPQAVSPMPETSSTYSVDSAPITAYESRCPSLTRTLGHFASDPRTQPAIPKPKRRYLGPSRPLQTEESDSRYMRAMTRTCAACGLQTWQCANASNYTGNEWNKFPRIHVHVEAQDHGRLLQYYNQQVAAQAKHDDRASLHSESRNHSYKRIKLYVVPRNGCEDRPVEVRVGLKHRDMNSYYRKAASEVEVYICEGKRAEIVHYMREQVEYIRFGGTASAYMIDKSGSFRVGALIVKSVNW